MRLLLLCTALMLSACGTVSVKESGENSLRYVNDAYEYHNRGIKALNLWREGGGDNTTLPAALLLLDKAFEARPDDVNIQYSYYDIHFTVAVINFDINQEQKLLDIYNTLNPVIRDQFAPPATVSYIVGKRTGASPAELESDLKRALEQNPRNARAWLNMSNFYTQRGAYWLAIASADRASRLEPDNPFYTEPVGKALVNLAKSRACPAQEKGLNKKAMTHFLKTAQLAPQDPNYMMNTAEQYLALGLLPLAWSQAEKAYGLAITAKTVSVYSKIAIAMGRFGEARKALESFVAKNKKYMKRKTQDAKRISHLLYMLQLTNPDESKKIPKSKAMVSTQGLDYFFGLYSAVTMQVPPKLHALFFLDIKQEGTRPKVLLDYVTKVGTTDDALLEQASNDCQRTEYHFAIVNRAVGERDPAKSKYHLEQILRYRHYDSDAYLWAKLLMARSWWLVHPISNFVYPGSS